MKDQQAIAELYESVLQLTYQNVNKNLFYGFKSLLENGDDFEVRGDLVADPSPKYQAIPITFTYKGTRFVLVSIRSHFTDPPESILTGMEVLIFENDHAGKAKQILGTNVLLSYDPTDRRNPYKRVGSDPPIRTIEDCVEYVRAVLDNDDDSPDEDTSPVAPAPKAKTRPKVFA